jgi:hypothetical protein
MIPLSRWRDDTGSLPSAVLLTMVGVSMSALLVPMVLTQLTSTRQAGERVHALHAAQTGLDTALGHIRAAVDGSGNGVLGKLPCGTLTGTVGAGGTARYAVTIRYYPQDPQGKTAAWKTANEIKCAPGGGTLSAPAFVLLESAGTDKATGAFSTVVNRTVQGTYTVQTTNQNIAGGLIHIFRANKSTDPDLCLDATTEAPAAGTDVKLQPCSAGSQKQKFGYFNNLNLILISSKTAATPLGMCLDAGSPHTAGRVVEFQPCTPATSPQQQWSFNDYQNWEGTSDGSTLDGFCFNVQSPNTAGSIIVLGSSSAGNCHKGPDSNTRTFHPEAAVGAGAAGEAAGQLVNFAQFGRCLDVTQQKVDYDYLIAWPCKQAPDPDNVKWNQKWTLPTVGAGGASSPGRIYTDSANDGRQCLRSPGSTNPGAYVTLTLCPSSSSGYPELRWTRYGKTDRYETSYRIVSNDGHCLATVDQAATPTDYHNKGDRVTKIVLQNCSGSTLQKWNADPNVGKALPLKDIREN